jgi:hypothetical protein
MNKVSSTYPRFLIVLLWLIVICLSAHFLHDIQPGHTDLPGIAAMACSLAIHTGLLASVVTAIVLAVLVIKLIFFPRQFARFSVLSVPIPPPIQP